MHFLYPSLQYHMKQLYSANNSQSFTYLSQPPKCTQTIGSFTNCRILYFPECPVVEIIQYVALTVKLFFNYCYALRFFHVFSWLESEFLFIIFHLMDVPVFLPIQLLKHILVTSRYGHYQQNYYKYLHVSFCMNMRCHVSLCERLPLFVLFLIPT